jgi:hypothetical protein
MVVLDDVQKVGLVGMRSGEMDTRVRVEGEGEGVRSSGMCPGSENGICVWSLGVGFGLSLGVWCWCWCWCW